MVSALHDGYAARIRRFGIAYDASWVPEVRAGGRYSDDHVREREARSLLDALDGGGTVVALDPQGDLLTSDRLARRLEVWSSPLATFVIGGPLGLHRSLLDAAHRRWSLSPLTFPHEIVRVLVAEQVYRALATLRGVPYAK